METFKTAWLETLRFGNASGDYSFHPEIAVGPVADDHSDDIPKAVALSALGADYDEKVFSELRISYRLIKP